VVIRVVDGLGAVAGADLGEDVVDVAFDCGVAEDELAGNLGVGPACGDEGQHLDLARGQAIGRSRGPRAGRARVQAGSHQALLDLGGEVGLPASQGGQGVLDLLSAGVLGEVAARAGLECWEQGVVVGIRRRTSTCVCGSSARIRAVA